jgi:hypothetical protein
LAKNGTPKKLDTNFARDTVADKKFGQTFNHAHEKNNQTSASETAFQTRFFSF